MGKSRFHIILFCSLLVTQAFTQDNYIGMQIDTLPYGQIPESTSEYTSATVMARMIDGLGFRYRWATEGLTDTDLNYQADSTLRTSFETLEHVFSLSQTILNGVQNTANIRSGDKSEYTWEVMREKTLINIKTASKILWSNPEMDLNDIKIIFQRGEKTSEYPMWNLINGPIADAIWHCGQVVSYRRSSGNPIDPRVNVFRGILRD